MRKLRRFDRNINLPRARLLGRQILSTRPMRPKMERFLTSVQLGFQQHGTDGLLGSLSKRDAPAFQARCAASNNSGVKNASCFSTTWSSHDCAQCLKIRANLHSSCTVGAKSVDRKFKSAVESIASNCRGVAQPGSAPALGAGGPEFESRRPDQNISPVFFSLLKVLFHSKLICGILADRRSGYTSRLLSES
jgi:hypothetical protein